MASTAGEATPSLYSEIDIKEEPILTDLCHQQPMKEFEQIYIKEDNIKLEIADDLYARDPLQLEEEKRGHESSIDKGSTYDVVDNVDTHVVVGNVGMDGVVGNVGTDGVVGNVSTDGIVGNVGTGGVVGNVGTGGVVGNVGTGGVVGNSGTGGVVSNVGTDGVVGNVGTGGVVGNVGTGGVVGNVGTDGVVGNVGTDGVVGKMPKKRGHPRKIRPSGDGGDNNVDGVALKRRKELENEVQLTNGGSESESIIPATAKDCNTCGGSGRLGARDVPATEFGNATRSTVEEGEVPSSTSQHLEPSSSVTVTHLQDLMEDNHVDSHLCSECHIPLPECEVCHRVCRSHAALRVHSAMHTGKPFTCSVCLKQFSRKIGLKVHSRVHTEKEVNACVMCPKKFTHSSHWKAHLRAHYGRRLHSCRVCNKTFSLRCKQNNHSRTHWGAVISL